MTSTSMTSAAAELLALGSATLGESGATPMAPRIKAVWPGARLAAPAFAVTCAPGDNLALHLAVTRAPAGSVLAVDVGPVPERGYWGEVLSVAARSAGIIGMVIDGCVRDTAALARREFSVFARGAALRGSTKHGPGTVGGEATVGGVLVRTGDWLVADEDGVVLVPRHRIDQVLAAGRRRSEHEKEMFDGLTAGATTLELLHIDPDAVRTVSSGPAPTTEAEEAARPWTGTPAVTTVESPVPSGAYSQGRWSQDLLFVAGVGPYDPQSRAIVGGDITAQTHQAVRNAEAILVAAGLDLSSVISTTVYLADLARDWTAFDATYGTYFSAPYPARAVVGAALKGILVEIVMTARRAP